MKEKKSFIKFLVVFFPIALIVMAAGSLLIFEMRRVDQQEENPISQPITAKGLLNHYKKLGQYMTPRGFKTEQEVVNLTRTTAYIEGTLSFMNTGMNVVSEKGETEAGRIWKTYTFHIKGKKKEQEQVLSYNYRTSNNEELACVLALAEALPNMELSKGVILKFTPNEMNTEAPLITDAIQEARKKGAENALCYDGIDWDDLSKSLQSYLKKY